jgi:hypothetical protein
MRKLLLSAFSVSLVAALIGCASVLGSNPKPVVFTAMGCGPYNPAAEVALERFIKIDNELETSAFMVHCGDIVTGEIKDWPESQYIRVAQILTEGNRIPTFIVPGDNEWNDQDDPAAGWQKWLNHFFCFDAKWDPPAPVERQAERLENFAFLLDGVLFIGLNKVGGKVHDKAEWATRLDDNAAWVAASIAKHGKRAHSAVIFAQAEAAGNTDRLVRGLAESAAAFGKPILYLHADGHKWYVIEGDYAPNITHVQMDLISSNFPPIQVTVTGDAKQPWVFDRRQNNQRWGTVK